MRQSLASVGLVALAVCLATSCVKKVPPPAPNGARAIKLLDNTPEQETSQFPKRREDVRIETDLNDSTPHIVAQGETGLIPLQGARARLYGDAAATQGISVDNFILIEVLDGQGKVLNRGVVGFVTDGVLVGNERVDNVGRLSFNLEPGEVNLTPLLPDNEPFRIRATALDYSGVGRVSDVYVVLEPHKVPGEEDLRDQ